MKLLNLLIVLLVVTHCDQLGSESDHLSTLHRTNTPGAAVISFLQISQQEGDNDEDFNDGSKVLILVLVNLGGCVLCFATIQGALYLSKRLRIELNWLQKNYIEYQNLLSIKQMRTIPVQS